MWVGLWGQAHRDNWLKIFKRRSQISSSTPQSQETAPVPPRQKTRGVSFEKLNLRGLGSGAQLKQGMRHQIENKNIEWKSTDRPVRSQKSLTSLSYTWADWLNILTTLPDHSYSILYPLLGRTLEDFPLEILKSTKQRPNDLDFGGALPTKYWEPTEKAISQKNPTSVQIISNLHFSASVLNIITAKGYQDLKKASNRKDRDHRNQQRKQCWEQGEWV